MGDFNQDPSMEEILASIKRVIAEDGRAAAAATVRSSRPARAAAEPQPAPEPEEDVLELKDPVTERDALMSQDSAAASRQSLAALAAMRQGEGAAPGTGRVDEGPLEAVVREMLRPMLKDWLDQRLPEIVEDMVAREIARITGKSL
jgi:hypothetical protein